MIVVFLQLVQRKQLFIIHFLIWVFYFGGMLYYIDPYWFHEAAENRGQYILYWILSRFGDAGFAYLGSEIVFQIFLRKGRYILFVILTILLGLTHYSYDTLSWNWFNWEQFFFADNQQQRMEIIGNTTQALMVSFIFYASKNWSFSVIQRKQLEDEVAQTELKFLKSQMSPHFLFNVFNNIYSLSLDENEKTPKAIAQLKSIMRYIQLFESKSEISLVGEEEHLQDYIALNGLRHQAKVRLKSNFQSPNLNIEPMIFLPFFENAFKHGKTSEGSEIRANIREKDKIVQFEITNEIDPSKRKDSVSGVGLENIKRRLPFIYKDFLMEAIQDEGKYKVKIRINLAEKIKL